MWENERERERKYAHARVIARSLDTGHISLGESMLAQGTRADILHFLAHRHQCRMELFDCQYLALRVLDCAHLTYTYRHMPMHRPKQATHPHPHTQTLEGDIATISLSHKSIYALVCMRAQNT